MCVCVCVCWGGGDAGLGGAGGGVAGERDDDCLSLELKDYKKSVAKLFLKKHL